MRPDRLYLSDIVDASDAIGRFLLDLDGERAFPADELRQSAILQKLIVIGEAASRLSDELRTAYPDVEWPGIVAFRNIVVHAYFSVKWEMVWNTATDDVPKLRRRVLEILQHAATRLAGRWTMLNHRIHLVLHGQRGARMTRVILARLNSYDRYSPHNFLGLRCAWPSA